MVVYHYICGCYYITPPLNTWTTPVKHYLRQVDIKAHTTILSSTSRTTLTQTFVNSSSSRGIKKLLYAFPLYDGVSVVGFKCKVGNRIITGEVQEKEQARATFEEAVDRGEAAGLLEQLPEASDVFTTTIGNVPANSKVVVEITYLGELKHDAEVDGVRFTIPTAIAPRYGDYPGQLEGTGAHNLHGNFEVTVDASLEEGFFIREMRSPSHPIAVSVGTVSTAQDATPSMNKASATLSLTGVELERDFILQVVSKEFGNPTAVLETHPTVKGHRALMATLVPKFELEAQRPEIVFVCDRSGSMAGSKITALVQALTVFLKSLKSGVVFNICSFGSRHDFLWKTSQPYNGDNLKKAMKHINGFSANYGGTEMLAPLQNTIERRFSDRSLEVFLVTDGEIWDEKALFEMLNEKISKKKEPVRVFTLGVGDGVSHSLIEGVARAGNGFSQAVGENEKLDAKVVRMLKGAMFPHITDYSLEVQYEAGDNETDDFEIVEKVADSLKVKLDLTEAEAEKPKKVISLFNTKANLDADSDSKDDKDPFKYLPKVSEPKLLQAPHNIPPLFPFNRTTVYLLMGPDSCQGRPKSVILRGTCAQGPLELEIPIKPLEQPGQTIHQLAAKKAIADLEEGRGWLVEAKTEAGQLIKSKHPSMFDEMVRREAVRLGVQFQVGGKWCSFVATEKKIEDVMDEDTGVEGLEFLDADIDAATLSEESGFEGQQGRVSNGYANIPRVEIHYAQLLTGSCDDNRIVSAAKKSFGGPFRNRKASLHSASSRVSRNRQQVPAGGIPDGSIPSLSYLSSPRSRAAAPGSAFFGSASVSTSDMSMSHDAVPPPPAPKPSGFGGSTSYAYGPLDRLATKSSIAPQKEMKKKESRGGKGLLGAIQFRRSAVPTASAVPASPTSPTMSPSRFNMGYGVSECCESTDTDEDESPLQALIALQEFDGSWEWKKQLLAILRVDAKELEKTAPKSKNILATALVVRFLETRLAEEKDSWELVVEKAREWIEDKVGSQGLQAIYAAADNALA